jgi:hypothetical protein
MNLSTINLSLQRSLLANPTGANEKIRFKVDSYYPDVTNLPNGVRENFEKHQLMTPSAGSFMKYVRPHSNLSPICFSISLSSTSLFRLKHCTAADEYRYLHLI